jgi:N-methylhydantoinase B
MSDGQRMSSLDPVKLEIIRAGLQSIPDLIEVDLMRTAFSPLIYEYKDYAVGLVDVEGRSIALAQHCLPGFLTNVLGIAVRDGIATYGLDRIEPGDAILCNYAGLIGQHLNNVIMFTPVFGEQQRIVAFMAVNVHWIDIGGRVPGSCWGTDTTELIQEGLQFRSVKLYRRGQPIEEVFRIIVYNTRQPHALLGDIAAQYAACAKGRQMFEQLLARHGQDVVLDAIGMIWRTTAAAARAAVRAAPDGIYDMHCFMDDDGIELGKHVKLDIQVRIEGDEFIVDYSNIADQLRGPFNSGIAGGATACAYIAFKYLFAPQEPANEGSFEPVKVIIPPGKFLSASANAPIGLYQTPLATVVDAIIAAAAPALPDRVAAGHFGCVGIYGFNGTNPRDGRFFGFFDTCHGGWGGSMHGDGVGPYKTIRHADNKDIPVETMEALYPLLIDRFEWCQDSAGPGRFRGGLGIRKTFRLLAPCNFNCAFERFDYPPWGLEGGGSGTPQFGIIETAAGDKYVVRKASSIALQRGDRIHIHTGAGGGYGPPTERDAEWVRDDVSSGYLSRNYAERVYGVVLGADGEVDKLATHERRADSAALPIDAGAHTKQLMEL